MKVQRNPFNLRLERKWQPMTTSKTNDTMFAWNKQHNEIFHVLKTTMARLFFVIYENWCRQKASTRKKLVFVSRSRQRQWNCTRTRIIQKINSYFYIFRKCWKNSIGKMVCDGVELNRTMEKWKETKEKFMQKINVIVCVCHFS